MQTMKRIHHAPAAATLFATVAFLASCVKTESAIDESLRQPAVSETIIFNATVTPKGVQTRSVNEAGETTWVVDEKIAVYYEKEGGGYGTATASVDVGLPCWSSTTLRIGRIPSARFILAWTKLGPPGP